MTQYLEMSLCMNKLIESSCPIPATRGRGHSNGNGRLPARNRSIAPALRTTRSLSLCDIGTLGA